MADIRRALLCALWALAAAAPLLTPAPGFAAAAQAEAEAAQKPPVHIAVLINPPREDHCFDPGDIAAIKKLTEQEQARINLAGGVAGRRLELKYLDDKRDPQRTIANVRSALANASTLAIVGLGNTERATALFEKAGAEIKASGIPFLSNISLTSIFAKYPNVFTTRASQEDERLPIMAQFIKRNNLARPAFVGLKGLVTSEALGEGLKGALGGDTSLVSDHRLAYKDNVIDPAAVEAAINDLRQAAPDVIFTSLGSERIAEFVKALTAAKVTPALFIGSRLDAIPAEVSRAYPSEMFQLAWDRLPGVYSERLRRRVAEEDRKDWAFEGRKLPFAPGWKTGACKDRPKDFEVDILGDANIRAIGVGAQYADMIALAAAAAASIPEANADIPALRARIVWELTTTYASGRGAFPGAFENWSFQPATRAAARSPFIIRLSPALGRTQLAPFQFVRMRDALRPVNTVYADIDLIGASRVQDNDKTFYAEFYLAIRDDGQGVSDKTLEFANAFLYPGTNERQVTVRALSEGGNGGAYPEGMKIYHVAGRFTFEPRFANYPFDTQRFSIDVRPKSGDAPFIIQPPPHDLRDRAVATDGWTPMDFYVGYDEDFVPTLDARTHERSIAPFYKASFTWLMKRETTDYFLRVVVPLGFILIVAYLSIFIPRGHFEAIVTIQVTALLSSVALYLALPQVGADATTMSDRIFLFSYMAVSLMIAISILRVNSQVASAPWLRNVFGAVHVIGIPLLVAAMAYYIYGRSVAGA